MTESCCRSNPCTRPGLGPCSLPHSPPTYGRSPAELAYAVDSASIDAANRSTGNHSLAHARVLRDDEYPQPVLCALCNVEATASANSHWCKWCGHEVHVGTSGVAYVDDDPPADWLGLAVWCGLSVLAACVSIGALMAARALGWLS